MDQFAPCRLRTTTPVMIMPRAVTFSAAARGRAAAAQLALRREQGRAGLPRPAVRARRPAARRAHADLPPHRARAGARRSRRARSRARSPRSRRAGAPPVLARGQPRRGARLHRRARRGARLLAAARARRSRARSTTSAAGAGVRIARPARPAARALGAATSRCASTRSGCARPTSPCWSATPRGSAPPPAGSRASRSSGRSRDLLDDWRARVVAAPPGPAAREGPAHRRHRLPRQERGARARARAATSCACWRAPRQQPGGLPPTRRSSAAT